MSRRIDKLLPNVQIELQKAIVEMDTKGVSYFIDSTLRSTEEQQALYAQGRQPLEEVQRLRKIAGLSPLYPGDNSYTVTKADGVKNKSAHQSAKAVDIVPKDKKGNAYWPATDSPLWKVIADVMVKYQFEAGLYWKDSPDAPHYTYIGKDV